MKPGTFPPLARELGALVARKNGAYGCSFQAGAFLALLYPRGISPPQYDDAFLLARIFDKCRRVAICKHAFGESPYLDIAGYGLLGVAKDREQAQFSLSPRNMTRLVSASRRLLCAGAAVGASRLRRSRARARK